MSIPDEFHIDICMLYRLTPQSIQHLQRGHLQYVQLQWHIFRILLDQHSRGHQTRISFDQGLQVGIWWLRARCLALAVGAETCASSCRIMLVNVARSREISRILNRLVSEYLMIGRKREILVDGMRGRSKEYWVRQSTRTVYIGMRLYCGLSLVVE